MASRAPFFAASLEDVRQLRSWQDCVSSFQSPVLSDSMWIPYLIIFRVVSHLAKATGAYSFWGDPGDSLPAMSSQYVDCEILPKIWDDTESIRDRLRSKKPLVNDDKGADVKIGKCVINHDLLIPVLNQIGEGCRLAEIDPLRDACQEVYKMNSRTVTSAEVDDAAWGVRDMVTFIKRKAQREEVSLEFRPVHVL